VRGLDATPILPRPSGSERNAGNQIVSCEGTPGLTKCHLDGDGCWDLGDPGDPERGVLLDHRLAAGTTRAATSYGDWSCMLVLDGSLTVDGAELATNDLLIVEPGAGVPALTAGATGVHLLEAARTAAACDAAELAKGAAYV
jgi:hypothetical protein